MERAAAVFGLILAMSKHQASGIAAMAVGAIVVLVGGVRVLGKAAGAILVPLAGVALVVIGVLLYTRVIKG
jgi:hypothetical protein